MTPPISRRRLLKAGALAGTAALAGCLGDSEDSTPTGSIDNDDVQELSIDGQDLVIRLREDHAVTRLNLIGPDGERYAGTDVAIGETRATIQILDIRPGLGGYEHYDPGLHELVVVTEEGSDSLEVDLVPDIRIVDVQQYRDGNRPSDLAKLAVTVENRGTGPTWVYDVTYRDAPNTSANDELREDPGLPRISLPNEPNSLIVEPGESGNYIGETAPILFTDQTSQTCVRKVSLSMIVGVASDQTLEVDLTMSVDGEVRPAGLTGQYTCSELTVATVEAEGSDD